MHFPYSRIVLSVIALSWGAVGIAAERSIRVALVLYDAPSGESTVLDPYVLGTPVTEYDQLSEGGTVYLEAWVSTSWPYGLTGAGLDVTYYPDLFATFCNPNDPGHPGNCQVFLGNWSLYAACPIFYGYPDRVCSDSGAWCSSDADCRECFGGPHEGLPCGLGAKLCSVSALACADAMDCKVCVGGDNEGYPCTIGATLCSVSGLACTTAADCMLCSGGDNDMEGCTIHRLCSHTHDECVTADDCRNCVGGDNDGLACATDDDCPPDGTCEVSGATCDEESKVCSDTGEECVTVDDCKKCVGGDNDGLACSDTVCSDTGERCATADDCRKCIGGDNAGLACATDYDCPPDGTCEVSGESCEERMVCSDTGIACVTGDDCEKCVGGTNDGLACTDTVCSDTGEWCTTASDCMKCVGGENDGLACVTNDDCPPDGVCEVSGEACEESKICSDSGEECVTDEDCMKCVGGDHEGVTCTIKGTVCSSNGEPCTTADDCRVCSSNSEPCTTADDCKKCVGGGNEGLACTIDDDCLPDGTCEVSGDTCDVSGDTCDDEDCWPGGTCEVSGETCDDEDCWPGGTCEVSGEVCHDSDCPAGGMCEVSGETCDDRDCPGGTCEPSQETCDDEDCWSGGTCEVSGETCDDEDCWPGGTCEPSGETCDDNPEKDCVPIPGVVQNVGGNNLSGIPSPGWWERIATIEFDIEMTPTSPTAFFSGQDETAGGKDLMFAFWGGGGASPSEVQFFHWAVPGGAADTDECVGGLYDGDPCEDDNDCQDGYCAGDGVLDALDNCPSDLNPGQEDNDYDMVGNVCDNCPDVPNPKQTDTDQCVGGLYHGDPCNGDTDCEGGYCAGDETGDACDNCPDAYNPSQEDTDECVEGSHAGLPCNYDADCPDGTCQGDGVGNHCDNCPDNLNSDQRDCDGDGLGDACETDGDEDGDGLFDTCDNCPSIFNPANEAPFDCNEDGDTTDPGEGIGEQCDSDGDGIGDACECPPTDPPKKPDSEAGYDKIRYISLEPDNPGRETALRVTIISFPAPFDGLNGTKMWVGEPREISENAGMVSPPPYPSFMSANLQCAPYCTDFGSLPVMHVTDAEIIPDAVYDVQTIGCECELDNEVNYSAPLTISTSLWGDLVKDCTVIPCEPPDGIVNVTTDVTSVLDKYKNLPGAVMKSRADLDWNQPDWLINISDVTFCLDAFLGFTYPPAGWAGPDGCPAVSQGNR